MAFNHQIEIGHAPSEQLVSLAEIVVNVEPGSSSRQNAWRGSSMASSSETTSRAALRPSSARRSRVICAMVLRSTRAPNGMALGMVGVEQAVGRCALDDLRRASIRD